MFYGFARALLTAEMSKAFSSRLTNSSRTRAPLHHGEGVREATAVAAALVASVGSTEATGAEAAGTDLDAACVVTMTAGAMSSGFVLARGEVLGLVAPDDAASLLLESIDALHSHAPRWQWRKAAAVAAAPALTVLTQAGSGVVLCGCTCDGVFGSLSVREALTQVAALRMRLHAEQPAGRLERSVRAAVAEAIGSFGLDSVAREHVAALDRTARRLLVLAVSLVGVPRSDVVLWDRPLAGLDSEAVRRVTQAARAALVGRSTLIAAGSVADLVPFCSRLALLADGQLRCIGTPQRLMERYAYYTTLTISLHPSATPSDEADRHAALHGFIGAIASSARRVRIVSSVGGRSVCVFHVPTVDMSPGTLTGALIRCADAPELRVEDWCLSRPSLDDAIQFWLFA